MTIATNSLKNDLAQQYADSCTHASAHTADPGTTGTSEVTGGAYARVAVSWGSPSNGVIIGTATINIPAGTTTTHAGLFNASSSGTFKDKVAMVYNSQPSAGTAVATFTFTAS